MSDALDPFSLNVAAVTDLVENPTNKLGTGIGENAEGAKGEKYDALAFDMKDEELLKLRDKWESDYATYEVKHKRIVEKNLESYLGKRADGQWINGDNPLAANIQFEAEETFLAATLAKNPEPVVYTDNTPEGNAIADAVKTMLAFHADQLVIRRKLSLMVRQWSIHHLGVIKVGWNKKINDVSVENRRIQNFIFDKNGYIDAYGDFVGYLGERFEVTAESLIDSFPTHAEYIRTQVKSQMGTMVVYTEWISPDNTFFFITFKDKVLDKYKNNLFHYAKPKTDVLGEDIKDESGETVMYTPRNHFALPKKPFIFLSVYSLQEQPHDITGLIEQNIANQNIITRRTDQADYNASASNNSYAFSEDNFDQETAKQAATARRKGNPILIPSGGPIDKAILPLDAQDLPEFIINQIEVAKNDLRTSWGVQGITAQPPTDDTTARGMILNQSHDTSRIGGGIGDAVEEVADNLFNWLTQLYCVFYDEKHFAAIMGSAKSVEYVELSNQDLDRQLIVSVSPDSLRPKDDITNINLAQNLFDKGAIGPKVLLKMLDFPDPDNAAADGILYKTNPQAYMQLNWPELMQQLETASQAGGQGAQTNANEANSQVTPSAVPQNLSQPEASPDLNQAALPKL